MRLEKLKKVFFCCNLWAFHPFFPLKRLDYPLLDLSLVDINVNLPLSSLYFLCSFYPLSLSHCCSFSHWSLFLSSLSSVSPMETTCSSSLWIAPTKAATRSRHHARHTHNVHLGCWRARLVPVGFFPFPPFTLHVSLSLSLSLSLSFLVSSVSEFTPTGPRVRAHRATSALHMSERMCVCSEQLWSGTHAKRKRYSTRGP